MYSGRVVALIPAHNEEQRLGGALSALHQQRRPPDAIVVVCDNCTDGTAEIARRHGATVLTTEGNSDKKAGALNQALTLLLPGLGDDDTVLVQDADSFLDPGFVETALTHLERGHGGVGGVFRGSPGGGLVGHLQRNEYARYARDVARVNGRCLVITGTAAMFRVGVLRRLSLARREGALPAGDGRGGIYDTTVLTEDNELTFALLHLGYTVISPSGCTLETEVMQTWRELWTQRLRWKRGAIENCVQYGLTRVTGKYWARQVLTMVGGIVSALYLGTIAVALSGDGLNVSAVWLSLSLVFIVERVVTVRDRGWRQMAFAATMYELILDYFLQACHVMAYAKAALRTTKSW